MAETSSSLAVEKSKPGRDKGAKETSSIKRYAEGVSESDETRAAEREALAYKKRKWATYFVAAVVVGGVLLLIRQHFMESSESNASDYQFDEVWDIFEKDCKCEVSAGALKKIKNLEKHQTAYTTKLSGTILLITLATLSAIVFCYWENYLFHFDDDQSYIKTLNKKFRSGVLELLNAEDDTKEKLKEAKKQVEQIERDIEQAQDETKRSLQKQLEERKQTITEIEATLQTTQQELSLKTQALENNDSKLKELKVKEEAAIERLHNMEQSAQRVGRTVTSAAIENQKLTTQLATAEREKRELQRTLEESRDQIKNLWSSLRDKEKTIDQLKSSGLLKRLWGW